VQIGCGESAARKKLQSACGSQMKAKAMAKARVNVLVGAPEHSTPSIETRLYQPVLGKLGWNAHGEQTSSGQPKKIKHSTFTIQPSANS
jgi:hypothetical protein